MTAEVNAQGSPTALSGTHDLPLVPFEGRDCL